jgi:hypothetical protein
VQFIPGRKGRDRLLEEFERRETRICASGRANSTQPNRGATRAMHRCYRAVLDGAGQGRAGEEGQPANDWSYIRLCHGRARLPVDKAGAKADKPAVCSLRETKPDPQRPPETACLVSGRAEGNCVFYTSYSMHTVCVVGPDQDPPPFQEARRCVALRCAAPSCPKYVLIS